MQDFGHGQKTLIKKQSIAHSFSPESYSNDHSHCSMQWPNDVFIPQELLIKTRSCWSQSSFSASTELICAITKVFDAVIIVCTKMRFLNRGGEKMFSQASGGIFTPTSSSVSIPTSSCNQANQMNYICLHPDLIKSEVD